MANSVQIIDGVGLKGGYWLIVTTQIKKSGEEPSVFSTSPGLKRAVPPWLIVTTHCLPCTEEDLNLIPKSHIKCHDYNSSVGEVETGRPFTGQLSLISDL